MAAITKQDAKIKLGTVPQEKRFWVADGRYLNNLDELEKALETMTEETYAFHANETKSDFAKWADEVIGDKKLAQDLKNCATRMAALKYTAARIKFLKSRAGA